MPLPLRKFIAADQILDGPTLMALGYDLGVCRPAHAGGWSDLFDLTRRALLILVGEILSVAVIDERVSE